MIRQKACLTLQKQTSRCWWLSGIKCSTCQNLRSFNILKSMQAKHKIFYLAFIFEIHYCNSNVNFPLANPTFPQILFCTCSVSRSPCRIYTCIFNSYLRHFSWGKTAGAWSWPSIVEVEDAWNYNSTPPRLHRVHRENILSCVHWQFKATCFCFFFVCQNSCKTVTQWFMHRLYSANYLCPVPARQNFVLYRQMSLAH